MRPAVVTILLASTLAVGTGALARSKPRDISWGKPGVSFDAYQKDTLECANRTYGLEVSMRPETVRSLGALNSASLYAFIAAQDFYMNGEKGYFSALSAVDPGHVAFRNTTYTQTYNVAARVDVVNQLQAVLDYCLTQRGYHRYRLTAGQMHELRDLKPGSPERAHYLYRLGDDLRVLETQSL